MLWVNPPTRLTQRLTPHELFKSPLFISRKPIQFEKQKVAWLAFNCLNNPDRPNYVVNVIKFNELELVFYYL